MTATPFELLREDLELTGDELPRGDALRDLDDALPLATAQAAAIRVVSQLLSVTGVVERQSADERRRVARYLSSFGTSCADVICPDRSGAFANLPPGSRAAAIAVHARIRGERGADDVMAILAAARMRHGADRADDCLVLATVLESLLRLPRDLGEFDRRRLSWYGRQLFGCWLEPREVAMLVHARWLGDVALDELAAWWSAVPERRPLVAPESLAELIGAARS
jgi:hypothetical protein